MSMHNNTPTLMAHDPRGLAVRTVDYWRDDASVALQARVLRSLHDVAGRAIEQWDPRLWALQETDPQTPASLTTVYALNAAVLRSQSVDAGTQIELPGLAAEVLWGWDSRKTIRQIEYDRLLRPVAVFEEGEAQPRICVERLTYGAPNDGDQARNQFGRLLRHDHPAGTELFHAFAYSGQCVENTRHFTRDTATPDWPESVTERQHLLEPGAGATSRWRFGALGHVLEQVDARANRQIFELTVDGRLRAASLQLPNQPLQQTLVSDIRYNAAGDVESELAGNGVSTRLTYRPQDSRLMVRHAQQADASVLQHLLYSYDKVGNILSIEDKAIPVRYFANQRIQPINYFSYDSLYQLKEATGWEAGDAAKGPTALANYRQSFAYDAGGNLLKLTHVGAQNPGHQLQAARYSNRCLPWRNGVPPSEAEIAAAFDPRGNLLALDQGRSLLWNRRNQLQSVTPVLRESGLHDQEIYLYGRDGLRVRKLRMLQTNARTVVSDVRYLPGLELRTDTGTGEMLQVITVHGGLAHLQVLHWQSPPPAGRNDQIHYGLSDHLGSVGLELTADARILSREYFYPFGEIAWSDKPQVSYKFIRYSGKERDATGLYDFGYRYYVPWLQRWLNPDPKGFVDGPNLYRMVANSPMTYFDTDGGAMAEASALSQSVEKQQALLDSVSSSASDLRNSVLNHAYSQHRFKALGRRVGTQLASSAVSYVAVSVGTAGGAAAGGLFGPVGVKVGAWAGAKAGAKVADKLISTVVDTYHLDRPINFKGNEMNPKAFIESVEPKKGFSLASVGFELSAHDPRYADGRARIGKKVKDALVEKAIDKVAEKLGGEAPGLIKTGQEFYHAARGLNANALSEAYEQTPMVIDLLEFRMQAINAEFAESSGSDPALFERIAELSSQTPQVVQALGRNQDFIELIAPKPFAGRQQSLGGRSRQTLARQQSFG